MSDTLDRFRTALKFSLWVWALYWPVGGLLLLGGGLDPVGIFVTFVSLGGFVTIMAFGALRTSSSRNWGEFMLERPMYLLGAAVVLIILAPLFAPAENIGLRLFATTYFAGILLVTWRLVEHVREHRLHVVRSKADQSFILFGIMIIASLLVFLDAWLPAFGIRPIGGTGATVTLVNLLNIVYPGLALIATRPFREPLRRPRRSPATEPMPAVTAKA